MIRAIHGIMLVACQCVQQSTKAWPTRHLYGYAQTVDFQTSQPLFSIGHDNFELSSSSSSLSSDIYISTQTV